jgi:hypothetical protein
MLLRQYEEYLTAVGVNNDAKTHRRRALREALDVLEAAGGDSWQARWLASLSAPDSGRWPACADRAQETRARLGMRFLVAHRFSSVASSRVVCGRPGDGRGIDV